MKALAHVVRTGSLTAAARALGVSQSAISQQISKLEAQVGGSILIRNRDGVQLTQIGQEIFELADQLAALDQQIDERLRGHLDLRRGHLSIIANAPQPALSLIAKYTHRYSEISVDFAVVDWATAMERVTNKMVDVAVVTDPPDNKDLYLLPVTRARYALYVRFDHPMAGLSSTSLSEISHETLLLPEQGSLTRRLVSQALAQSQVVPARIVTMTTFPVMKEAILQGIGIGIFLEDSAVPDPQLRQIAISDMEEEFSTCIVIPKYKLGLRITQSFLELVDLPPKHSRDA